MPSTTDSDLGRWEGARIVTRKLSKPFFGFRSLVVNACRPIRERGYRKFKLKPPVSSAPTALRSPGIRTLVRALSPGLPYPSKSLTWQEEDHASIADEGAGFYPLRLGETFEDGRQFVIARKLGWDIT